MNVVVVVDQGVGRNKNNIRELKFIWYSAGERRKRRKEQIDRLEREMSELAKVLREFVPKSVDYGQAAEFQRGLD